MLLMILGGLLIGVAAVMDMIFRERMTRAGDRTALLMGGAFNYAKYHAIRKQNGWSAWPVYLMWASILGGLGLLVAGFLIHSGRKA